MKKIFILIVLLQNICLAQAQQIQLNFQTDKDSIIYPFQGIQQTYGLSISGQVKFLADNSLLRVILHTSSNDQLMVYESYPLIAESHNFSFEFAADETKVIAGTQPLYLRFEIINAQFTLTEINNETNGNTNATIIQAEFKRNLELEKIRIMNDNIVSYLLGWKAGLSNRALLSYERKSRFYGEKYNLVGRDYYINGIFKKLGTIYPSMPAASNFPNHWDWRERHHANTPGSLYFDGDDTTFSGWISKIKNQEGCNACVIFGTLALIEAYANLYYNKHIDFDLSEQQLVSCTFSNICQAGILNWSDLYSDYLVNTGVVTEYHYPYIAANGQCYQSLINNADTLVKIGTSVVAEQIFRNTNYDNLKSRLLTYGPVTNVKIAEHHYVLIVGYNYDPSNGNFSIIYKDSFGTSDFSTGFVEELVDENSLLIDYLTSPLVLQIPTPQQVACNDLDEDGYYNWGIGPRPNGCGGTLPQDCDDSNPNLGPSQNWECNCIVSYNSDTIFIDQNTTWNTVQTINHPVVVRNGAVLTITAKIYFDESAIIVVKPGSQLIVDGGVLTKACYDLWKGIQIWGNPNLLQSTANQGVFRIINGGIIEYAKIGVLAGKKVTADYTPGYGGGIVQGSNSFFRNNEIDIEFRPYSKPATACTFTRVTFETLYPEIELTPNTHILLHNIKNVLFRACYFGYTTDFRCSPIADLDDHGTGITAYDSDVRLVPIPKCPYTPCNEYDSCKFNYLRYGLRSFITTPGNISTTIERVGFSSNATAIYMSGVQAPSILNCDITLTTEAAAGTEYCAGIYLEGCTRYTVNKNIIKSNVYNGETPSRWNQIGVYIKNSGTLDNEIYDNNFAHLHFGVITEGINKGNNAGLCIKCNDFSSCFNDIMIIGEGGAIIPGHGIKALQGTNSEVSSELAGNTFTNYGNKVGTYSGIYPKYWNYLNNADYLTYNHHKRLDNPLDYPKDNNYSSSTILRNEHQVLYLKSEACPQSGNGGIGIGEITTERDAALGDKNSLTTEYNLLVDEGNTPLKTSEANTATEDDALELSNELGNISPFVSDDVLSSYINNEAASPDALLRDVLVQNPQVAKNDMLLNELDNREQALPDYMMAQIMQGAEIIGEKENMESDISVLNEKIANLTNQMLMIWQQDSTITDYADRASAAFLQTGSEQDYAQAVLIKACNHESADAASILQQMIAKYGNSAESDDIESYLQVLAAIEQTGIENLDNATITTLNNLMQHSTTVGHLARGLLVKGNYINYVETIAMPQGLKSRKVYSTTVPPGETSNVNYIKAYPNPAKDYIIAEYSVDKNYSSFVLVMTDLSGKQILSRKLIAVKDKIAIPVTDLSPATYLLHLNTNKGEIARCLIQVLN